MKSRMGAFFLMGIAVVIAIGIDLVATHLMIPETNIGPTLTAETYHLLIIKWFCTGVVLGMAVMFFMVEAWIWKNWKSWNKFCCDHHEKVYKAQMGISQGRMLRR